MPFKCQKIAKNLTFFQKKCQKFSFFPKNCRWQFFRKKWKFLALFLKKNVKFLAIFWHSNGNFPEGQVRSERQSSVTSRHGRFSLKVGQIDLQIGQIVAILGSVLPKWNRNLILKCQICVPHLPCPIFANLAQFEAKSDIPGNISCKRVPV